MFFGRHKARLGDVVKEPINRVLDFIIQTRLNLLILWRDSRDARSVHLFVLHLWEKPWDRERVPAGIAKAAATWR